MWYRVKPITNDHVSTMTNGHLILNWYNFNYLAVVNRPHIICDEHVTGYVTERCAAQKWYITYNSTLENQTVVDNWYALWMPKICLFMGLFMLGLSQLWKRMEFGNVQNSFNENLIRQHPQNFPHLIKQHIINFNDKHYYHRYMMSLLLQFVCIATVFITLYFVLQVQGNGKMTDVSSLLERKSNDDYWDSIFPEQVYCKLSLWNLYGGKSTKMYQCFIGVNFWYRCLLVTALWVHLGLLCVTIIDFIWHIYLSLYKIKSIPLKNMDISKRFFCIFLENNITFPLWQEVIYLFGIETEMCEEDPTRFAPPKKLSQYHWILIVIFVQDRPTFLCKGPFKC